MNKAAIQDWYEENQRCLVAALALVREALERPGAPRDADLVCWGRVGLVVDPAPRW